MTAELDKPGFPSLTIRYKFLFAMLMLTLVVSPLLPEATLGAIAYELFIFFVLMSSLIAIASSKKVALVGLGLTASALVGGVLRHLIELPLMADVLTRLSGAGVLALTTSLIVGHVGREQRVTGQMIFGAMSAYLLIGFIASALFGALSTVDPQTLNILSSAAGNYAALESSYLYFSFVTLTTLGYGDVAPVTPIARTLAALVAVTGQLFVAVLLARVVALYVSHSTADPDA